MAVVVPKPKLTEFGIYYRLESCEPFYFTLEIKNSVLAMFKFLLEFWCPRIMRHLTFIPWDFIKSPKKLSNYTYQV